MQVLLSYTSVHNLLWQKARAIPDHTAEIHEFTEESLIDRTGNRLIMVLMAERKEILMAVSSSLQTKNNASSSVLLRKKRMHKISEIT